MEIIIFLAFLAAVWRLVSWDTETNLYEYGKCKCFVWVNLQIIHDRTINKGRIIDFILNKFPGAPIDEIKYYHDYIKTLLGNRYSEALSLSDSWRIYINPNRKIYYENLRKKSLISALDLRRFFGFNLGRTKKP